MRLTLEGIRDKDAWEKAGIKLPSYDVEKVYEQTKKTPVWVHFGIGNIFRVFLGTIADSLLSEGLMTSGLTCVETFDYEVKEKIYDPFDNLALSVILNADGTQEKKVLGCFGEAILAKASDEKEWSRLKEVFSSPSLRMVSFTITEKGYALKGADGQYLSYVQADFENGPEGASGAMAVVAAMLLTRFRSGAYPLSLVSMDNCSQNGRKLREAVLEVAGEWKKRGFTDPGFMEYISDERRVAFPWTMIDKITPRPSPEIAAALEEAGIPDMQPVITSKKTYIAPFVNAEKPQYLVVEDNFPNGRPALESAGGLYLADRETVNKSERMKVTVCLNPIHTALCTYDCMLGYELFADGMSDPELSRLAGLIGYKEGMAVVPDPGILSPKAFLDEVMKERFPNKYLGDTSLRIATDISQMVGIRFGETIRAYVEKDGTAESLTGIPLAIAGWLRYLLAVDDEGRTMELAPDPMIPQLQKMLEGISLGDPGSADGKLAAILSNANIFGINLYEAGLGEKIEEMFKEELAGPGAVRRTLLKYLAGTGGAA